MFLTKLMKNQILSISYSSLVSRCHDKFVLAQVLIMTAADEGIAGL